MSASFQLSFPTRLPRIVPALLAVTAAAWPLANWQLRRWLDGSGEPLGAVAWTAALATLLVAVAFAARDLAQAHWRPWIAGLCLVGLGCAQTAGIPRSPLLAGLLATAALAAAWQMPRGKAGVVALLVLSLPWIATLDYFASYPLRLTAATISHALLQGSGLPVSRTDLVLADGGRLVGIDPACAGVRMLWSACFVAAVTAARLRFSWRKTLVLLGCSAALAILGNSLRASVVFFPESGRVTWPDWLHPAIGLAVHGTVLVLVLEIGTRLDIAGRRFAARPWWLTGRRIVTATLTASLLALLSTALLLRTRCVSSATLPPAPDPHLSLAADVFAHEPARITRRHATSAKDLLRPARESLTAAGFTVDAQPQFLDPDGQLWACSLASRNGRHWRILERYTDARGQAVATDAQAWFWHALARPNQGPWTATTIQIPEPPATLANR